jgi:hypothetical protein
MNTGDTPTVGFFASASAPVPFDPANNPIQVIIASPTGTIFGGTSAAVTAQGQ